VGDECLVNRVGYQGKDDLPKVRTWQTDGKIIRTYDGLGPATVPLAVVLEIIENLGTRHYPIVVLAKKGD